MSITLSPREAYRLWAPRWETDPSAIVTLETRFLAPWLTGLRGKTFLDLSCGTGRWLAFARAQGATVFGTDLSSEMLAQARSKTALAAQFALADTCRLPFADRCADVALCALSLGHMASLETAMSELARVINPGGSLLISDFHPDAIRRGWKRTFRAEGQSFEIETHPYSVPQLIEYGSRNGLRLEDVIEPGFGEPEREIFERAGKSAMFDRVRDIPAVLLGRWTRI